jgi:hypothetical protein
MTKHSFINTQLKSGIWEGDLTGAGTTEPQLKVTLLGVPLDGLTCTHDRTRDVWRVQVPIPAQAINDGLQTFVVTDASGTTLTSFSLLAGDALADDLRAEIDLLRSELDLLKKAFRQHCHDS